MRALPIPSYHLFVGKHFYVGWLFQEHNLDFEKLLDASSYKEDYRDKMILWGEEIRCRDPGYFCRHAIQQSQALDRDIWIVSDARRHSDIRFFKDNFGNIVQVVRIVAQDDVRQSRGWSFVKGWKLSRSSSFCFIFIQRTESVANNLFFLKPAGVDDAESECGLDDYQQWDFLVTNNNNKNDVEKFLQEAKILTDSLFRNGLTNT